MSRAEEQGPDEAGEEWLPPAGRTPPGRRRLEQTRDDTDRGWGEGPDEDEHERWLLEQRPPHWE